MGDGERSFPCSCGQRHYTLSSVADIIDMFGPTTPIRLRDGREWRVPIIYLLQHRPELEEIEELGFFYGWKPVVRSRKTSPD